MGKDDPVTEQQAAIFERIVDETRVDAENAGGTE
jgi:hypothetical protein